MDQIRFFLPGPACCWALFITIMTATAYTDDYYYDNDIFGDDYTFGDDYFRSGDDYTIDDYDYTFWDDCSYYDDDSSDGSSLGLIIGIVVAAVVVVIIVAAVVVFCHCKKKKATTIDGPAPTAAPRATGGARNPKIPNYTVPSQDAPPPYSQMAGPGR